MDFLAHLLWSGIIFVGPQFFLACFCGVLPDLAAFLPMMVRPRQGRVDWHSDAGRQAFLESDQYRRSLRVYSWTHSLVIWGGALGIGAAIWGVIGGEFPWFLLAGILHIFVDIPTHSKAFYAPMFLTPFSKFQFNGTSWANKKFMLVNYALIVTGIVLRLIQFQVIPA